MDPKIVEPLVRRAARAERSPLAELTPREREVLAQIAEGKSNAAIAEALVLTKRAVEKHINSIFLKLNLAERRGREQARQGRRCCSSPSDDGTPVAPRRCGRALAAGRRDSARKSSTARTRRLTSGVAGSSSLAKMR